jgi:NAD(P)-dependent dehydrogenase (short-subunit alcohol dehydrogenase family)
VSTPQKKVALITGVSSGIGLATAKRLAAAGFRVFGTSRKPSDAGSDIEMLTLDVVSGDSVRSAVAEFIKKAGRIDVLVNNAGLGILGGAEESSIDQARQLFETNFFGTLRTIAAVLPHMRAQGSGRIINVSSVFGFMPAPFMALYSASKHALEAYSESLDHEVRGLGIRVALIEPAQTRTAFEQNMMTPDSSLSAYDLDRGLFREAMAHGMAKADPPEVVAEIILKAANSVHPKRRYTAGKTAGLLWLLRRFAPAASFDQALRKTFDLRPLK